MVLAAEGRFEEARAGLEAAVAGEAASRTDEPAEDPLAEASPSPTNSETWSVFAVTAYCQLAAGPQRAREIVAAAHRAVERALAIDPEHVESHMMRGFLHLECGDFERGWPEYEWRRRGKQAPRRMPGAEWKGEPLPGQSILLHAEQGLGDTIQFVRYCAPGTAARGSSHAARPATAGAIACSPVATLTKSSVTAIRSPPMPRRFLCSSLPAVFQTSLQTVPADVPTWTPTRNSSRAVAAGWPKSPVCAWASAGRETASTPTTVSVRCPCAFLGDWRKFPA